jgi:hypothetical protein
VSGGSALEAFSRESRARRSDMLLRRFPDLAEMAVVDLGGTAAFWRQVDVRPLSVTVVNLKAARPPEPWLSFVRGDACAPPSLDGREFDLVFSNSLIEHVGGHFRRAQLAEVVHRLAPHHWVQTPYRYFPVEPHWMFPGFQFLPVAARAAITRRWRFGHVPAAGSDRPRAIENVLGVELLSAAELSHYFPSSEIVRERVMGMTKGITAVR